MELFSPAGVLQASLECRPDHLFDCFDKRIMWCTVVALCPLRLIAAMQSVTAVASFRHAAMSKSFRFIAVRSIMTSAEQGRVLRCARFTSFLSCPLGSLWRGTLRGIDWPTSRIVTQLMSSPVDERSRRPRHESRRWLGARELFVGYRYWEELPVSLAGRHRYCSRSSYRYPSDT